MTTTTLGWLAIRAVVRGSGVCALPTAEWTIRAPKYTRRLIAALALSAVIAAALLAERDLPKALTSGFPRALLAASIFLLASAIIATRATNTRGEPSPSPAPQPVAIPDTA